ncbi:MAG: hypothetical protein ACYCYP_09005 [Leptospirales bacterium]
MNVDPDNRILADVPEADWNAALRQLDTLQQEHDRQRLGDEARKRIRALARDFPAVWNTPRLEAVERKRMLILLVEDVTHADQERQDLDPDPLSRRQNLHDDDPEAQTPGGDQEDPAGGRPPARRMA